MISFSFIIPVKPKCTLSALQFLNNLSTVYPFEIIVVEGCKPSKQRNMAAQAAEGDILYFLDDDSCISTDSIAICANHFSSSNIAVSGGPSLTPKTNSPLQKLFGIALSSPYGSGSMCNRYRSNGTTRLTSQKELILCNMAIKRDVFVEMNGFDERLYPNEENELLDRIQLKGLQLIHDPAMSVYRSQRETLSKFTRQMFSYGRGRGQQTRISHKISMVNIVPLLFLMYLLILPLLITASYMIVIPFFIYLILNIFFSIEGVVRSKSLFNLWLFFLFPHIHISNACGLIYGLIIGVKQKNIDSELFPITLQKVKSF